jgi:hypothetical protein
MPLRSASVALPLALWATAGALGTPLRQDGYSFRPPEGFRMVRMDAFHGTRVGGVPYPPGGQRFLSAALVDGEGQDASSLLVSVVEGTLVADETTRDAFSTAVVRHFAEELGVPLTLDRAQVVRGPAPRIEVRGTLKQRDQVRAVLVAALQGEGRHVVMTFSVPAARLESRLPTLRASLETFRPDSAPTAPWKRRVTSAILPALGLMLLASLWLWRRQRRALQGA